MAAALRRCPFAHTVSRASCRPVHMPTRIAELVVLFGLGPVLLAWLVRRYEYRAPIAPLLWVLSCAALQALYSDPTFDAATLWSWPRDQRVLAFVALRFAILGAVLSWLGLWYAPDEFMQLPRRRPWLWLLLVVLYPTLSAVPQCLLWRVLFVQRYAGLFEHRTELLAAGALAFSIAHLTYRSARALVVTAIGGALFLDTYLRSGSLLLSAAEHGAYGILAFSAGLGRFMQMGRRWRLQPHTSSA